MKRWQNTYCKIIEVVPFVYYLLTNCQYYTSYSPTADLNMIESYSQIVNLNSDVCVGVHILMLLLCLERHRSSTVSDERSTREADNLDLDGLLAVGRGLGVHDVEGQRIQQVRSRFNLNT